MRKTLFIVLGCLIAGSIGAQNTATDLTTHMPKTYEASDTAGGYNTPLVVFGGREYEVYYINRDTVGDSLRVSVTNVRGEGIISVGNSKLETRAKDGWFAIKTSTSNGAEPDGVPNEEFRQSIYNVKLKSGDSIYLKVNGFDQFSFYGKDASTIGKHFDVDINGVRQTHSPQNTYSIRRDSLSGESLICLTSTTPASNATKDCFVAFSLRLPIIPEAKYVSGNDSTQVVYQTQSFKQPIYYYTKYSRDPNIKTEIHWSNPSLDNMFTLHQGGSDELGDSLYIDGVAQCQVGEYSYYVASYLNNEEINRVNGKIYVSTFIQPDTHDTIFDAYTGEPMDTIFYTCYALAANPVSLTWDTENPGVTGKYSAGKYIITGTPTKAGVFGFTVSINGGNSIKGTLNVLSAKSGAKVLYLYQNNSSFNNDGVYLYLTSAAGGSLNLVPRKANENGARTTTEYNKYKWVLISEDVDADNAEVLAIVRDNTANLPVLNMKGFTYAKDRLNWGEPNNGTTTNNSCFLYVQQKTHPIFDSIDFNQNGSLQVLNKVNTKGLMPIDINNCPGTLCLATSYTRDMDDYDKDGELQTVVHEIPRGPQRLNKYICFPLANTKNNLTSDGKKLLSHIVTYLLSTASSPGLPVLEMTSFKVDGFTATINQADDLIELVMTQEQFEAADSLSAVTPIISVADPLTHVVPGADEELDLRYATFMPATFVVTDYINRRAYSFKISLKKPEGLEDIYEAGEWVNIFDIYGRKITTTNEDIYTMDLPRGMYIIVTEKGQSIKLMK